MNQDLKTIAGVLSGLDVLTNEEKASVKDALKKIEKALTTTEFKLNKSDKERRVLEILLEETIEELQKKKSAIEQANEHLVNVLNELKSTQAQLIQQEKMASLGELTAGIAHEIQNPLNFVNNFAAVNRELLSEMKGEMENGNYEEAEALANSIEDNEEKIAYHGKRAEAIVKGMLQHARASSGEKQPTAINQLADEYLRLSYQGIKAKDKTFYATIETRFDESIGQIAVAPQDIGRVLLNLFNNAFYAVREKKRLTNGSFEPHVTVSTRKETNHIVIAVKDNGTGMSQRVADKVFQPFFTTKPAGEGTGLGLSLSYDIITKGHGGQLFAHSTEGEGSEFFVKLPLA